MTQTQPEALNIEEFRAKVTRAAREPLLARIAELEAVLSAMGEKGNPVEPADIPRATDQDTHFFLAGWNGRAAQVDPHEHFRNAAATAPAYPAEGVPAQAVQPSDALIEAVDAWFADNTGLGGCSDKDVAELAAIFATQPAAQGMEADLADEQIDETFNQMPDGAAGFLKSWGYRQFARAVLAAQAKQGGVA